MCGRCIISFKLYEILSAAFLHESHTTTHSTSVNLSAFFFPVHFLALSRHRHEELLNKRFMCCCCSSGDFAATCTSQLNDRGRNTICFFGVELQNMLLFCYFCQWERAELQMAMIVFYANERQRGRGISGKKIVARAEGWRYVLAFSWLHE